MSGADAPSDPTLRLDAFLGGRVQAWQPVRGYRAGEDAVLLAAAVAAAPGQRVVELGTGAGVALACLCARVPGLEAIGLELQPAMALLAARTLGDAAQVVCGDLTALPLATRPGRADHVLANPPFFAAGDRPSPDPQRRLSRQIQGGGADLTAWIRAAALVLRPGRGTLTVIHRPHALAEILAALQAAGFGGVVLRPVHALAARAARRLLVAARHGSRAPLSLLPPLVLMEADHAQSATARAILRDGAAIAMDETRVRRR